MAKQNPIVLTIVIGCCFLLRNCKAFTPHIQQLQFLHHHQKRTQRELKHCSSSLQTTQPTTVDDNNHNRKNLKEYNIENEQIWKNQKATKPISNLLICGDGDLSFSANVAQLLDQLELNTKITATVLEEQNVHHDVYQRSIANKEIIQSSNHHDVKFGIDATKLEQYFPNTKFERIQFNFPHWRGKANHRYNRQLIDSFLKSANLVLDPIGGEIHIALCEGQGGSNSKDLKGYRDTWTPNFFASQHGMMLMDVVPFSPSYNLSSHRGVDRGFKIGQTPEMYIFGRPSQHLSPKKKEQLLCCRHELHIILPDNVNDVYQGETSKYSILDIKEGNAIQEIIQSVVPDGIRVEVPERRILRKESIGYDFDMALYLVVYCGETKVLRRDEADKYRHDAECEVEKLVPLRENRRGRLVSKPFPYYLLKSIIKDHTT